MYKLFNIDLQQKNCINYLKNEEILSGKTCSRIFQSAPETHLISPFKSSLID